MDSISIKASELQATISTLGAELLTLRDTNNGINYLWNGDPAFWAGHSPILFPIVGEASDGSIKVNGKAYPIGRHGFARRSTFDAIETEPSRCRLRLSSSEQTRTQFPFEFELYLDYEIIGRQLHVRAQIVNSGDKEMPVSFGFHPAFRWPLVSGVPKEAYAISFDQIEDLPIRRLVNGLLADAVVPSPVHDRWLGLREAIFTDDALIFDRLKSRHVTYGASSGPKVIVRFGGMPHLGIWSKPGADFICIEPWQGFASPADFHGEFKDKPGTVVINAGGAKYFEMQIQLPV